MVTNVSHLYLKFLSIYVCEGDSYPGTTTQGQIVKSFFSVEKTLF